MKPLYRARFPCQPSFKTESLFPPIRPPAKGNGYAPRILFHASIPRTQSLAYFPAFRGFLHNADCMINNTIDPI